jgi:hypothetical protein
VVINVPKKSGPAISGPKFSLPSKGGPKGIDRLKSLISKKPIVKPQSPAMIPMPE